MTGLKFPVTSPFGHRVMADVGCMSDDQITEMLTMTPHSMLPGVVRALAVWIRDNVVARPTMTIMRPGQYMLLSTVDEQEAGE